MKFIGDFHIHSHYSISTSKDLVPEHLDYWARIKGIRVVGMGDFTHPGWIKEIKEKLIPAEDGLFTLKNDCRTDKISSIPSPQDPVRFMLTAEVSTIYKKDGKVRKIHNVIFAPDFKTVERIQQQLVKLGGNITSDGRPIVGLDARDLLEIALNASERILFVPAHIWTPWFSVLGDKSGFNTIEECYGDLADHIYAVETGLSSDPPMNWMCSFLDRYTLISNSDAHSPAKLGREANLFDTDMSYDGIVNAIKTADPKHFLGTVEFFPQEGKYHYAGHRKCNVCWNPVETVKMKSVCPVCGRKVTSGVMNRVAQLADRDDLSERKNRPPFYSLIPLKEIIAEIVGVGPNTKQVGQMYERLIYKAGSEFNLLLHLPLNEIKKVGNEILEEAIRRMRHKEVYVQEGFDGEYGHIKVFDKGEVESFGAQESLFQDLIYERKPTKPTRKPLLSFDLDEYRHLMKTIEGPHAEDAPQKPSKRTVDKHLFKDLNSEQQKAVEHFRGPALIIAGPGTGKTRVLAYRIAQLIRNKKIDPKHIVAVTFTNKAAGEIKDRLTRLLDTAMNRERPTVTTFHALGLSILREHSEKTGRHKNFYVIDEHDKEYILLKKLHCDKKHSKGIAHDITNIKQRVQSQDEIKDERLAETFERYESLLKELNAFDLDGLLYHTLIVFRSYPDILTAYRTQYQWLLVDEYQDINHAQYTLIRMLMPEAGANLCVIGDPNQAIYGFRGAHVQFIKKFIHDYPTGMTYHLTKSYRCTGHILNASRNIIEDTTHQERFLEGLHTGVKITIAPHPSDKSEAEYVARTIEHMIGGLRFFSIDSNITEGTGHDEITSLSDFAVLCRTKAQMKAIEKAFHDHSIPYQAIGNDSFFTQEPIRSVMTLLKSIIYPNNSLFMEKITAKKDIRHEDLVILKKESIEKGFTNVLCTIIDNYFAHEKENHSGEFKKLITIAHDFNNDGDAFLTFTALGIDVDTYIPNVENVTLMTLHAAKGLEFNCVFIIGCEDGLIPYSLFEHQQGDVDEERRLLYVGMTRAKKFLFLSHAHKRFIYGKEYHLAHSPFLDSIEKELIELETSEYKRKEKEEAQAQQLTLF